MILSTRFKYRWWIVGAFVYAAAFLHPLLWPAAVIGVAFFVKAIVGAGSVREVVGGSMFYGTIKAMGALSWLWYVYPVKTISLPPGALQLSIIGISWVTVSMAMGLAVVLCAVVQFVLLRRDFRWIYFFPVLFTVSEVMSSFFHSVYSLGPGGSVNMYFSFGYLGNVLANFSPLLHLAVFGGVYAISLVGAVIALCIYVRLIAKATHHHVTITNLLLLAIALLWITTVVLVARREPPAIDGSITAVTTRFDRKLLSTQNGWTVKRKAILQSIRAAAQSETDVLVLPEDSRFTTGYETPQAALADLKKLPEQPHFTLYDSARTTTPEIGGGVVLRAYIYDVKNSNVYTTDKQYLVPQGEYVQYSVQWLLSKLGFNPLLKEMEALQAYRPGPYKDQSIFPADVPPVMFCFENTVPTKVRNLLRQKNSTSLIIHPVSHAWFSAEPTILDVALTNMLKIQAVWNNVYILQAGNMAESFLVHPNGSIQKGTMEARTQYWGLYKFNIKT